MNAPSLEAESPILRSIAETYRERLNRYGPTARGVFWKSTEGQILRFEMLIGVIELEDEAGGIAINDLGCGYGALFDFLSGQGFMQRSLYFGYDICPDMIREARRRIVDPRAQFIGSAAATEEADYSFVSGTYNMKLGAGEAEWADYIKSSLLDLWSRSRKGLAFNMLSQARRVPRQRDLYYADWHEYEAFCSRELSPRVTVLRDYTLAEWTIHVRRASSRAGDSE